MIYQLFITFFMIGLFTFGGGYAMIPLISQEVVGNNWLTIDQLIDFIGISEATPGAFAINISTFVGISQKGTIGAIAATLGIVFPSFIIIIVIAKYFRNFRKNEYVQGVLFGLKPAIIGLIAAATYSIAELNFISENKEIDIRAIIIFAIIVAISSLKKMHPIMIITISAILGVVIYGVF